MQRSGIMFLCTPVLLCIAFFANAQVVSPVWVNDIGSAGVCKVIKIVADKQNNVYVTGWFKGTVDLSPTATVPHQLTSLGVADVFIAKFTTSGTLVWCKSFGGTGGDVPISLCLDDNNNIYLCGTYRSPKIDLVPGVAAFTLTNGNNSIFMIKLDNSGSYLWSRSISCVGPNNIETICADHIGNVFIGGAFSAGIDLGDGKTINAVDPADGYFAKYNGTTGSLTWAIHYGGTSLNNQTYDIAADLNNDLLITGASLDIGVNGDFLAKYDTNGSIIWIDHIATGVYSQNCLITDASGNVYLSGYYQNKIILDTNTPGGSLKAVGFTDAFVSKYDTNGKFIWADSFGNANAGTYIFGITLDNKSDVYVCGVFDGNPALNPASSKPVLTQVYNGVNAYAAKYDANGKYIWAANIGSPGPAATIDMATGIALTPNNDIMLGGAFIMSTDFDPRACVNTVTAQSREGDGFLTRFSVLPTPIITGFTLPQQRSPAVIDTVNRTINIIVKSGTDLTKLSPTITTNSPVTTSNGTFNNGTLSPASGVLQDLSSPFVYSISGVNCTTYDYTVTVTVTNAVAGTDQSLCNNSTFVMNANTPQTGATGTWSVVQPAGYAPFAPANINDPFAVIKNVPKDTKVVLRWTVINPSIKDTATSDVSLMNLNGPVVSNNKDLVVSNLSPSVMLDPAVTGIGPFTYLWQPANTLSDPTIANPIATPLQTTTYKLIVTNANGCSTSALFNVSIVNNLVIPDAFTPNQDGINDKWVLKNIEGYPNCEVNVYNRSGQLLFYSKGYPAAWDGTYNGKKLPPAVYYYVIKANDSKQQVFSGPVSVMY